MLHSVHKGIGATLYVHKGIGAYEIFYMKPVVADLASYHCCQLHVLQCVRR